MIKVTLKRQNAKGRVYDDIFQIDQNNYLSSLTLLFDEKFCLVYRNFILI